MHKCEFPGCSYTSEHKHNFNDHHIIPRASKGTNKNKNLLRVCLTCHNKIYIPGSYIGTKHAKIMDDSIICEKIIDTSGGLALMYHSPTDTDTKFHLLDSWRNSIIDKLLSKFKETK